MARNRSNATAPAVKGDVVIGTGTDTSAVLAVGNNGETLVADSSATTGLRWQGNFAAGKNKIINGDFNINQRNFTSTTTDGVYTFDRFRTRITDGTNTFTARTFTPGTAPVAGYESKNYIDIQTTGQTLSSAVTQLQQVIEDVRTFANQTATISFWAKANTGTPKVAVEITQDFGGGSSAVNVYAGQVTLTTSWARYSITTAIPSISGKTIGSGADQLQVKLFVSAGSDFNSRTGSIGIQTNTFSFWGVQLESGSVATAFQTATGTLAGELAACQRYYVRVTGAGSSPLMVTGGLSNSATQATVYLQLPVVMRTTPTSVEYSNLNVTDLNNYNLSVTAFTLNTANSNPTFFGGTATHNTGATANRSAFVRGVDATGYLGVSAEL